MSYTIDVYRKRVQVTTNFIDFFAFVSFFPQLVAGPIERASNLLNQFKERKQFDYNLSVSGLRLILYGLFKKVVIADNLGLIADQIFNPASSNHSFTILLGTLIFGFQIYCDFSGYSDMAIGLARLLSIRLMKNFETPYFSASFGEFWQRWHISLSSWFRDYVYISMGGSKTGDIKTIRNIIITFAISGLWHGAKFTFIIWGLLHGLMLAIEKSIKIKALRKLALPIVFVITMLLWIPFRANNMEHLQAIVYQLFKFNYSATEINVLFSTIYEGNKALWLGITFVIFLLFEAFISKKDFDELLKFKSPWLRYSSYYFLALSILFLSNLNLKPFFIYFQF